MKSSVQVIPAFSQGPYSILSVQKESNDTDQRDSEKNPSEQRDLILSFSSIGHDSSRPPSPEFVQSASGRFPECRETYFIADASRSWGNDSHFATVVEKILTNRTSPKAKSLALGLSMGGFCALYAAQLQPIDSVLAFGPQYSPIDLNGVGKDRWLPWTRQLPPLTQATAPLSSQAQIYILHGLTDDLAEAQAFPRAPNVTHVLFDQLGHSDLVPYLKSKGLLQALVEAALHQDRRRFLRLTSAAGGQLRKTETIPI